MGKSGTQPNGHPRIKSLILVLLGLYAGAVLPAGITVDDGASLNIENDIGVSVDLGCDDLVVNGTVSLGAATLSSVENVNIGSTGTLNGNTGTIEMSGDWTKHASGTFNPGTSSVEVSDGCGHGASNFSGSTSFYNLSVATATGRTWLLEAGSVQSIANALSLTGAPGNLLAIRSTDHATPNPGHIDLAAAGSQFVDYVDVQDNFADGPPGQWMAPGYPSDYHSVDSGGLSRWFGLGFATFAVSKHFTDGNPGSVDVHISCFSGTVLDQDKTITEAQGVVFNVTEIDVYFVNNKCTITEVVPPGYAASYTPGGTGDYVISEPSVCEFTNPGDLDENTCLITNTPLPMVSTVYKDWIIEGSGGDAVQPDYKFSVACNSEIVSGGHSIKYYQNAWHTWFHNGAGLNDTSYTFSVIPNWEGDSHCWVDEKVYDSSIESETGGCQNLNPVLGSGDSCTITNSVFYEGIPTLGQFGKIIMALLMLGLGLVGLRRFV